MPVDIVPFAIVQPVVVKGDIAANVARHVSLAETAAREGARLVLFPELALTGYEPALAAGLAVSAEIAHSEHAAGAARGGADLYAASVLISENGYAHDAALLCGYAREHRMPVAMANHGGPTGGWASAGRSALWDEDGNVVIAAEGAGECLLVARRDRNGWHARAIGTGA